MGKLLVVVDMQNDFIDGSLGTKEAVAIIPKVVAKIKEYQNEFNGETVNIFATRDTHYDSYLNTSEGKNLPVEHCIRDTHGWEINEEIKQALNGKVSLIDKNTFGSLALAMDINSMHNRGLVDTVELVGVCTDICVVSNALLIKAHNPELEIIVDASCCAGVTPESHKKALDTMKMCQIKVINEAIAEDYSILVLYSALENGQLIATGEVIINCSDDFNIRCMEDIKYIKETLKTTYNISQNAYVEIRGIYKLPLK